MAESPFPPPLSHLPFFRFMRETHEGTETSLVSLLPTALPWPLPTHTGRLEPEPVSHQDWSACTQALLDEETLRPCSPPLFQAPHVSPLLLDY